MNASEKASQPTNGPKWEPMIGSLRDLAGQKVTILRIETNGKVLRMELQKENGVRHTLTVQSEFTPGADGGGYDVATIQLDDKRVWSE